MKATPLSSTMTEDPPGLMGNQSPLTKCTDPDTLRRMVHFARSRAHMRAVELKSAYREIYALRQKVVDLQAVIEDQARLLRNRGAAA